MYNRPDVLLIETEKIDLLVLLPLICQVQET